MMHATTSSTIAQQLCSAGIQPTRQRLAIAQVLLQQPVHMTADAVLEAARRLLPSLSRATVYNTLSLLVQHGLLHALHLDADHTIYDSRTAPHAHLYDEETFTLQDFEEHGLSMPALPTLPALPAELELTGIDLIVRVRRRRPSADPVIPEKTSQSFNAECPDQKFQNLLKYKNYQ